MKILNPTTGTYNLSLITRDYTITTDVVMLITDEASGESESLTLTPSYNDNYCLLSPTITILKEGRYYSMKVTSGSDIIYRDRIFATASTDFKYDINDGDIIVDTSTDDEQYVIHE